jgi:hypothetical protein
MYRLESFLDEYISQLFLPFLPVSNYLLTLIRLIFEVCLFGLQLKYAHLEEEPPAEPQISSQ